MSAHIVPDQRYPHLGAADLGAVDWFAHDMKRKLEEHHNKGDRETWLSDLHFSLLNKLDQELSELDESVKLLLLCNHDNDCTTVIQEVIDEAADVGNFAMMIADKARSHLRDLEEHKAAAAACTNDVPA